MKQTLMAGGIGEMAVLHDVDGTSVIIFNASTLKITRLRVNLPKGFVIHNIRILGSSNMLLYCHSSEHGVSTYYELNIANLSSL